MIKLHHLENSRSQRVIWLLESLGLEYEVKRYERDPKTGLAPKELLEVCSLGKSPILEIEGEVLPESGAIFQYLLSRFDSDHRFHPRPTDKEYKDYLFWMHFAEGSLMWPLVIKLLFAKTEEKVPFFIRPVAKLIFTGINKAYLDHTLTHAMDYVEENLKGRDFFLGSQLSAVDMMMSFPLEAAQAGRFDLASYTEIKKFIKKIKEMESYKKAIEIGGEYAY
ncbi:MAG: glutathione S-transferase [Halobacteriovoraceae bacterium]|nr:glutathione S-transferase [Halobacteriovoraceae bacterium]|tara:strand:- start:9756 stop:10421 length:666 start_codon:yes stop_codon:yes gene_type:complete